MDTKRDIPFILNSVDYEDSYTGSLTSMRRIIYTFFYSKYICMDLYQHAIIKKVSFVYHSIQEVTLK